MPVRSLSSSVLRWPDRSQVDAAARAWALAEAPRHAGVLRVGYFGSYARGNWGPGSDLDLLVIMSESAEAFERRAVSWDLAVLPVPADLLIYTAAEWTRLSQEKGTLPARVAAETVWILGHA